VAFTSSAAAATAVGAAACGYAKLRKEQNARKFDCLTLMTAEDGVVESGKVEKLAAAGIGSSKRQCDHIMWWLSVT